MKTPQQIRNSEHALIAGDDSWPMRGASFISLSRKRAFTLIELLVVIVILGILMAVAVPTFLRQQSKAQDSRTQQYLTTAYKAIRASTPDTGNQYPSSTSMVSWITQSEPELTAQRGSCLSGVASAPQDAVLVDSASTANALTLCARSQSGNVWKLTATATGQQQLLDGTLVPLTLSGNEITDATRAANIQGDGASSSSSSGVWAATTNLVADGGAEASPNSIAAMQGGAGSTISKDTTIARFGSASEKITTDGTVQYQGLYFRNGSNMIAISPNTAYSASAWVNISSLAPGGQIWLRIEEHDAGGAFVANINGGATAVTSTIGSWVHLKISGTTAANVTQANVTINVNGFTAATYNVDGVQLEQKPIATPYVETAGSTATRGVGRVQAPAALINVTQGWVALRVRMGFSSTTVPGQNYESFFSWGDDGNNRLDLIWRESDGKVEVSSAKGGAGFYFSSASALTFNAGDTETVIGTWTSTTQSVSLNGGSFTVGSARNASEIPTLASATFDIGNGGGWTSTIPLDGDVLWFACGTGTLSNSDAATINSWGDTDPKVSAFPAAAQADFVWNGVGATGSLK